MASRMAAVLLVAALAGACGKDAPPAGAAKPAIVKAPVSEAELTTITLTEQAEKRLAIVTVPVEQRTLARTRNVGGEIVVPSGAAAAITAPVAGLVQPGASVPRAGAIVSRGQMLFRLVPLQPSEREAAIDARQALEAAVAQRDAAARRVERAERLLRDGAGSRRAFEEARAELAVAQADEKAASGRLALGTRSGTSDGAVLINAAETGVVQAIHVVAGQSVAANAPMLDLVRLTTVWIRVPIYAGESAAIDPAVPADVLALSDPSDAAGTPAAPVAGPPTANAATAAVDLYYAMSNPSQRFRPGERVTVRLARRERGAGLVVPKAALLHDAYGGTWVYVSRGSHVYARARVAVEDISGSLALLSRGPVAGARVVTDGAAELFGVEFGVRK